MRPRTDTLTVTRHILIDQPQIEQFNRAFEECEPVELLGYYWRIDAKKPISSGKLAAFEYTLTNPYQTITEWLDTMTEINPKTKIFKFTRWPDRSSDQYQINQLDRAFGGRNPVRVDGHYWSIDSRICSMSDDSEVIEYTLTNPCKTAADWLATTKEIEREHIANLARKDAIESESQAAAQHFKEADVSEPLAMVVGFTDEETSLTNAPGKPIDRVIYIAGPMTGYEDCNRHSFNDMADAIRAEGNIPLNPATLPDGLTQAQYMNICLSMIFSATAVHMLSGWQKSKGANAEHALAEKLGLPITYQNKKI